MKKVDLEEIILITPIDHSLPPVEVKASPNSRYIPVEVKRQVWQRDRGQCTYTHQGRKSKTPVQIPQSVGGYTNIWTKQIGSVRAEANVNGHIFAWRRLNNSKKICDGSTLARFSDR